MYNQSPIRFCLLLDIQFTIEFKNDIAMDVLYLLIVLYGHGQRRE